MDQFKAPEFAGAREASKGILGDMPGAKMHDKNISSVMQQFQQTGGNMTGRDLEMFMRTSRNTAKMNGMTYNELLQMGNAGSNVGGQMGFSPQIGVATALQAGGFGGAFQKMAGQTNMTGTQARQLDQELRLAAAQSPMANMLGAGMAMAETGMLKGKSVMMGNERVDLGALSGNDANARNKALGQLSRLSPGGFVDAMKQAGVNPDTASQFLGAQAANKDQIARHGIQDVVRGQQVHEVRGMMAEEMSGSFTPALRQAGVRNPQQRRELSMGAGAAIQAEMEAMAADPKAKNLSPEARNNRLAAAAGKALAGSGLNQEAIGQLTAGAVRSMEERVRADPDLQKFGDVAGLLNMNRQDILAQGANNARQAAADAEKDMGKKDPAVQKADEAPNAPAPKDGDKPDKPDKPVKPVKPGNEDPNEAVKRAARIQELKDKMGLGGVMGMMKNASLHLQANTPEGAGRLTEEQKELVRLQKDQMAADKAKEEAGAKEDGKEAGGDGKGGGKTQHIKITGNLTVKADGAAMIDADNEVPPNP
jgi:hypothetical protein